MRCPARVPTTVLSLVAAGVLTACAGQPTPPPISTEAGGALADQAEVLANALDDDRACEANAMAQQLLGEAEDRFAAGELSEPALTALVESVAAIRAELTCQDSDDQDESHEPDAPRDDAADEGEDDEREEGDDDKPGKKDKDDDRADDKDDDRGGDDRGRGRDDS